MNNYEQNNNVDDNISSCVQKTRAGVILVVGGVGPVAGNDFLNKIAENTDNGDEGDSGHLNVNSMSYPEKIGDRTAYLQGKIKTNPANGASDIAKAMMIGALSMDKNAKFTLGVPCNTFHVPKIFDEFLRLLEKKEVNVDVVNMIEETGKHIEKIFPNAKKIGLMSTTGTRDFRIYHNVLEKKGFELIEVDKSNQEELHDIIYNAKWGIKSVTPPTQKARDKFLKFAMQIIEKGAEAIILGCTEIPLVFPKNELIFPEGSMPLIDPADVLARKLIEKIDKNKVKK